MAYKHEIFISLNNDNLKNQIDELKRNAKVEITTKTDGKIKDLLQIVENLQRINKLASGKWDSKKDLLPALLSVSQKLNAELSKTNKDDNLITTYQKQMLVLANTLKQADKEFKNLDLRSFDFGKLITKSSFSSDKIKDVEVLLDTIKKIQHEFVGIDDIGSINIGSLIDKNSLKKELSSLETLADEIGKTLKFSFRNTIKIEDILSDTLPSDMTVGVETKPTISDPQGFADDVTNILKESGAKAGIEVKPIIHSDAFVDEAQKKLDEDNATIGINSRPVINDPNKFQSDLDEISADLDRVGIGMGINITPSAKSLESFGEKIKSNVGEIPIDISVNNASKNQDTNDDPSDFDNDVINRKIAEDAQEFIDDYLGGIENLKKKITESIRKIKSTRDFYAEYQNMNKEDDYRFSKDEIEKMLVSLPRNRVDIKSAINDAFNYNSLIDPKMIMAAEKFYKNEKFSSQLSNDKIRFLSDIVNEMRNDWYSAHQRNDWYSAHQELDNLKEDVHSGIEYYYQSINEFFDNVGYNALEKNRFQSVNTNKVLSGESDILDEIKTAINNPTETIEIGRNIIDYNKIENEVHRLSTVISKEMNLTKDSVVDLQDALFKMFKELSLGAKDIDLSPIRRIFEDDANVYKEQKKLDAQFNDTSQKIKSYLKGRKINITRGDAEEFGDNWNNLRQSVGFNVFRRNKGDIDIIAALNDMNAALGTTFDLSGTTQDALRQLFDAVREKKAPSYLSTLTDYFTVLEERIMQSYDLMTKLKDKAQDTSNGGKIFDVNKLVSQTGYFLPGISPSSYESKGNERSIDEFRQYLSEFENLSRYKDLQFEDSWFGNLQLDLEFFKDLINQLDLSTEKTLVLGKALAEIEYELDNNYNDDHNIMGDDYDRISNMIVEANNMLNGALENEYSEEYKITTENVENAKRIFGELGDQYSKTILSVEKLKSAFDELVGDSSQLQLPQQEQLPQQISPVSNSLNNEQQAVDTSVNKENQKFDELKLKISEVTDAVNRKTDAIIEEGAYAESVLNKEIEEFYIMADAIETITNAINTLSQGGNEGSLGNLQKIIDAINTISQISVKDVDFSNITKFLNNISKKTPESLTAFSKNIATIKEALGKLEKVKSLNFDDTGFEKLSSLINAFPSTKKAESFNQATVSIKTGFDNLGNIKGNKSYSSLNNVLSSINELLNKTDELKNLANIINKPSFVTKEAKESIQRENQLKISDALKEYNKATNQYKSELNNSGAVSDKTVESFNKAQNNLENMKKLAGTTVSQIKQIDSAVKSANDSIFKVTESVKNFESEEDKNIKKTLKSINDGVDNGAFLNQIVKIQKELDAFSISSEKTQGKVKSLLEEFNIMSNVDLSDNDRIEAFEIFKTELTRLNNEVANNKIKLLNDKDFQNDIDLIHRARNAYNALENNTKQWENSDFGSKHTEILNQIKSNYSVINDLIKNGNKLTEDQVNELEKENRIIQSTLKYQSNGTFLTKKVSSENDFKSLAQSQLSGMGKKVTKELEFDTSKQQEGIYRLTGQVKQYDGSLQNVVFTWNKLSSNVSYHTKDAGKQLVGLSGVLDKLKKKIGDVAAYWVGNFLNPLRIIGLVRQGIGVIQQYDDAFVELRKVSNDSIAVLENFKKASFDIGETVGTTGLQIQKSAADFLRLGESIAEAKKSAETANILFNVSEFQSIDAATEALISMSQAYDDIEKIDLVNKMNLIGNNFAISTEGLSVALQDSASALQTANNTLDESIALITAGNRIAQDPSSVGKGIRTIALRLTGTKEAKQQLQDLGEDVDGFMTTTSKLRDTIMNATKVASNGFKGFDILTNTGNYKSTYEIKRMSPYQVIGMLCA